MDPATWDFPEAELESFLEKAEECQAASAEVPRVLAEEQCPDREVVADSGALEAPPAVAVPAVEAASLGKNHNSRSGLFSREMICSSYCPTLVASG